MKKLPFLDRGYENSPIRDFWRLDEHDIPERPGAYILLARPGFTFMYPRRNSSIFYIGQARNVQQRLRLHLLFGREARDHRKETLYWPRYEWAAAFGARYTVILCRPRERSKRLEEDLLAMFAEHYRAWPIANGVGGWSSLLTLEQLRRRRPHA